ncbi:MAG: hypothetical protein FWG66_00920 [Spirochaetes bacterium]|nr:hypothetical protein [Spirochaetota bacterium]
MPKQQGRALLAANFSEKSRARTTIRGVLRENALARQLGAKSWEKHIGELANENAERGDFAAAGCLRPGQERESNVCQNDRARSLGGNAPANWPSGQHGG